MYYRKPMLQTLRPSETNLTHQLLRVLEISFLGMHEIEIITLFTKPYFSTVNNATINETPHSIRKKYLHSFVFYLKMCLELKKNNFIHIHTYINNII